LHPIGALTTWPPGNGYEIPLGVPIPMRSGAVMDRRWAPGAAAHDHPPQRNLPYGVARFSANLSSCQACKNEGPSTSLFPPQWIRRVPLTGRRPVANPPIYNELVPPHGKHTLAAEPRPPTAGIIPARRCRHTKMRFYVDPRHD